METTNSDFCDGRLKILDQLNQREKERLATREVNQKIRESQISDTENLTVFQKLFSEGIAAIEDKISSANCIEKLALSDYFNIVSKDIIVLQEYVAASSIFLRVYDIRKCQERLQQLSQKIKEIEENLLPKKKFGFKKRPNLPNERQQKLDKKQDIEQIVVEENKHDISNKMDENFCLRDESLLKRDVSFHSLTNCVVKLQGNPATIHMNKLEDCTIICGPVSTSIFVNNCKKCTLVVACQQLRMHSSCDMNIYLHVTSKGIIEDCFNLEVAPYNLFYEKIDFHYDISGLDRNLNNWDKLDDFNWLSTAKCSPNWKVMEPERRKSNW